MAVVVALGCLTSSIKSTSVLGIAKMELLQIRPILMELKAFWDMRKHVWKRFVEYEKNR